MCRRVLLHNRSLLEHPYHLSRWTVCLLQFDIIMLDVAAPDPDGDLGTLNSIPAHFLNKSFIEEGLCRRLRQVYL